MNLLRKIERSELRVEDLDYFHLALGNRHISRKGIYAHLGRVPSADICVQIADFFTRVHGIAWVFISGALEDRVIVILRNDGYRKDAGRLAKKAFGSLGSAGGHEGAARAEIPFEVLKKEGVRGHGAGVAHFIRHRLGI
jgi:nanoRNase/pAp phosphatase (c-di-AMP/oligoRNAs hydrolase)